MPTVPLSDEVLSEAVTLKQLHGTMSKASEAAGVPESTFRNRILRAAERGLMGTKPVLPGFAIKSISTRSDDGSFVKQTREAGDAFALPAGHHVRSVSALVDAEGRETLKWVKTSVDPATPSAIVEAVKLALANVVPAPSIPTPTASDDDLLTVYPLADLHLGMHAWGRETGQNYDLKIAASRARTMTGDLIAQSRPSRHAVILGLGDFFHMNDQSNMTPRSGHLLDVDGRWPKVLATGVRLAMDMIELAAAKHESVAVRFIPGNHDPDATIALTVALSVFYAGNDRITIDDAPGLHWYHRFGNVLLGATHGHTMKPDRMAMMLATDRRTDWGATEHKHMFFGHIHHESAREVGGVRVESFSTIAAKDAYAHGGGYRSGQALNAITFHREHGEIGRHRVTFLPT